MSDKSKPGVYVEEDEEDEEGYCCMTIVWPDGSIQEEYDGMESEDAKFHRGLSWTVDLADRAIRAELEVQRLTAMINEIGG
jgi:hypothetical protein